MIIPSWKNHQQELETENYQFDNIYFPKMHYLCNKPVKHVNIISLIGDFFM